MKNNGKSSKPIIAAHSTDTGTNSAKPGNGKQTGNKARGSRVSRPNDNGMRGVVLERISDGILAFDADMNHVYVDERAAELVGREAQDLVGKSFFEAYPESTGAPFADACRRAFETQTVIPFDGYFPSSNSWFEGRVYPSNDGLSVLISDRGLPEQEEILRTIEESEEKFYKAFHSSPVAKLIVRVRDGQILDVNQKFVTMFGVAPKEGSGSFFTLSPEWEQALANMLQHQDDIHEQELSLPCTTGELCYMLVSAEWLDIDKQPCVLIDCMDVTERKKAEEKVREISEFPLQNPNPVMRFHKNGELLYANPTSDPLLDSWQQPDGTIIAPEELRNLLPIIVETGSKDEIELKHKENIYTCLLVPVLGADYVNLYFSDITSRKQAQESLQALIHQTTTGITQTDLQGRLEFVNQSFCDMVGYSEPDLIGRTIWDINHPEDVAKSKRLFEKLIVDGESFQLETRILRRNGTILWVSLGMSPLRDPYGKTYSVVSVIVDITRRKRAEESLMDSARRTLYLSTLSDLLRPLSDPEEIEKEAVRILGAQLKADRAVYATIHSDGSAITNENSKFHISQYIPEDLLPRFRAGRAYITSGIKERSENGEAVAASNEPEQVQAQVIIPLLQDGQLEGALFVQQFEPREWRNEEVHLVEETAERMQTALERARAEQEQRESERRFQILADTVPSIVWSTAPDGTIQYLNEYWHDYTGLNLEQTVSNWAELTLHPDDVERYTAMWKEAIVRQPDEYVDEARYRRNDGEYRWFQSRAVPVRDEHGDVTAWYGVTTDIHDRVEKQAELVKVINNTPFMMTRCSRDLRYRFISRTYAEMIGRSPEDVEGKLISEIMGEEGLQIILPHVEQVLQGKRVEYEADIPFKGIGTPTLHIIYAPDYDEQGNVVGWFASITDITARKAAEREKQLMLEREQTLRAEAEKSKVDAEQATVKAEQELSERKLAEAALGVWTDSPLPQDARPTWLRLGVALLATAVALLVRGVLHPLLGDTLPLVTLYGAVVYSVWYGGVDAALLSVFVGYVGATWFFSKPDVFFPPNIETITGLVVFLFSNAIIIYLGDSMRRAQRHAHQSAQVAVERQRQAEFRLEMQKHAEEALRESERKFNLIYHKLPFVAALSRLDNGVLVDVNEEFERTFGYSRTDAIGKTSLDLGINPDAETRQRMLQEMQQDGMVHNLEMELETQAGRRIFLSNMDTVSLEGEKYILNTIQDITERRLMEQQLRASEEKYRRIVDTANEGIWEIDAHARTTFVNPRMAAMLGCTVEEMMGTSPFDFIIAEDNQLGEDRLERAKRGVPGRSNEFRYRRKDGSFLWTLASSSPQLDEQGNFQGSIALIMDITERKKIELALRESERKFSLIYNNLPFVASLSTLGDVVLVDVNDQFEKAFGYTREEAIGKTAVELGINPNGQGRSEFFRNLEEQGSWQNYEAELFTKAGEKRIYLVNFDVVTMDEQKYILSTLQDITERKHAEHALAEYARQQTALYQFSEQLQRVDSADEMDDAALDTILNALHCDRASILLSDEKGIMHFTAWRSLSDQYRRVTDGHSPWTPDSKDPQPIYYNDAESSDLSDELKSIIREEGICALAFIPLISNGKLIGKFMTYYNSPHTFNESEMDVSLTIARQFTFGIERLRAQQNLQISEDRLRLAVAAANIGIWDIDLRRRTRAWSKEGKAIYGLAEDDYLDFERQLEMTHPDDRAYVDAAVREFRDVGSLSQLKLEHRILHPDGSLRWVEVRGEAVYEQEPLPVRLIGTIIDVTERKRMEEQLAESNRKLSEILASIQDDFYVLNRDWKFIYASPLFTARLNKEPQDFVGKSIWEMFPKRRGTILEENFRAAMEQREVRRFEIGEEDTDAWYRMTAFPSEDGITVIGTDVTERKRAEDALRQSEERFAQFMQYLPGLAWIKDIHGRYVFANATAEKAFNVPREQLYGKTDMEVFPPEVALQYKKNDERAVKEGKGAQIVETLRQDDGILHYSLVTKFPILGPDGNLAMIGGTAFDITERKQAEDALRENQAMLQSFYDSAPFLMGIAELDGNNINAISGNRAVAEYFGVPAENVFGSKESNSPIEIDRMWIASYRRSQKSGKPVHFEYQHPRESGYAWLSVAVAFIGLGPTGNPRFSFVAEDVTERKRIEAALRLENERFMRFIDSNIIGIVIGDASGRIVLANDYYLNLLGVTREEFTAAKVDWKQFTPPEWLAADEKSIQELNESGVCEPYEKEYIRTDGTRVPVYIANAILPGQGKEIAAFVLDMTERKRAENRLSLLGEISELTRRLEDPIELMASVADVVGRHFQVSRCLFNEIDLDDDLEIVHRDYHDGLESVEGSHRITDYSSVTTSEMIAGRTVVNYDSKTDLRTANDYERSYLPTGERTYVAVPLMRDDRWVASLWVSDNKPRHWSKEDVSLLETIAERTWTATEKLRIDAALRESQQRLSLTYSHAAIGLVETAPDSRILQCNDAYASVLGYTREELIGRSFLDITYEEDARREADLYRQLIEKQIPFYRFEKRFVKKDGALIWSEMVRTVVLDGNGNARFGIGAAFNIDERKQREEALRARTEEIETLMEVNPIGILVAHDPECNYITGNPTGYSLLGFSTDSTENLSKPRLDELKPSQSHRVFRDGVELSGDELPMQMSARLGMEIEEQELELRFEDGTQKYIYFYTKPLFDANGNTRGTVAAMLDITERRLNEEALKAAREKAEASASRIARLQEVTAALSAPLTPTQVAEVMIKKGVPSLGAAVGTMMEASPDGQTLMIRYSTAATLFVERFKHTPISMKTPASDAYSSGKLIWIESREQYLERYPHLAADIQNWKYQAALSIPMEYKGHTVGVLNLSFESITPYSREDEEFAITLARQGAQALERAKAEDSLRASEERYRAIINQTTVGILRKDRHGNMLFVNQAFCEMLGYNSVELIDKSIWEVTHPDDIEKNRELYNQMMRDGLPFRIEKRLIHRDGSIIWVLVSVSPLLDAEGKPQSAVSVYSDITLRKYAESELHRLNLELEDRVRLRTAQLQAANESLLESEATSRLILESMPDGIVIINKEGQVVYCNAQVETLFGYKPAEVLGQSVTQLIPERYQQALGLERELFGQRKDQTQFPADVLVSPISSRTTWDRIITIRDMTEQRLAQEAIRKNEEKLRSLFEVLPVGISFLDNEGNVTEMNSTLTHILGLSKTEIVEGKFRPRRYVRADGSPMPPREFASVRARTEQKPVYNVETGIVKENGQTLWTSVNAAPVDIADVDVVVATIDVTARKQVEDELHKSRERLRILSRRLVEVQEDERHAIARELHDRVGQNLAALNLNLNILRSQLSVEALQVIGTRLSDSVALVNQILGITRNVMADLRSDVLDEYGLESALREYADQFTQRTGIQVVSDKSATAIPRLDSSIEMTLLRIAQEALTNVARHAKANRATISIGADEDAVYMSIQDDGIGILSWQKANQPGSHGLRIIRERAEALGGSVQVHSAYKKGTNIEVKIPLSGSSYQSPREKRS